MLGTATEEVVIKVAADSGAVANCISPDDLPCDVKVDENTSAQLKALKKICGKFLKRHASKTNDPEFFEKGVAKKPRKALTMF